MEEFKLAREARAVPHAVAAAEFPREVDAAFRPREMRQERPCESYQGDRRKDPLCYNHRKFGIYAYMCKSPSTCPMKNEIVAPGNARAGR